MKTKITKDARNLMIALLLGDGTISSNYSFKLSHSEKQKEYLLWKIEILKNFGIRTNGLKTYVSSCGYNKDKIVYYTQLVKVSKFNRVLRRVFYKPKKYLGNIKLLNRLDALGLAIWYMDDGHINIRKTNNKIHGFYIKISLCEDEETVQNVIEYFKQKWDISFYKFKEKSFYSICCGTAEGIKFINIIKNYVPECMKYKIQYNLDQRVRPLSRDENLEMQNTKVKI